MMRLLQLLYASIHMINDEMVMLLYMVVLLLQLLLLQLLLIVDDDDDYDDYDVDVLDVQNDDKLNYLSMNYDDDFVNVQDDDMVMLTLDMYLIMMLIVVMMI